MTAPTVLLTGFGPFPGVPVNASGRLVPRLARAARTRFPAARFHSAVIATEWRRGLARVSAAIARLKPDVVIHFGVSPDARGFVVEQRAANACVAAADGAGLLPAHATLEPGGPVCRTATLPVRAIMARLAAAGLPVFASNDAGAYLCNAVLFQTLALTEGQRDGAIAGFVHIPASLAAAGHGAPAPVCPLSLEQALAGGLEIIGACLDQEPWRGTCSPGAKG